MKDTNVVLNQESMILEYFEGISNPKKARKLAQRLYFECKHDIQRKLCTDILESDDPIGTITLYISRIKDFIILHEQYIEEGHHGILFTGETGDIVYPVSLDVNPNWIKDATDFWNEDDEKEIMLELAKEYLRTTNLKRTFVKIALFQEFGFSGIPRVFEVSRGE